MLTKFGRSQVEVQRCSLSSEGPRLRSSSAQYAQTLSVEVQQCPLRTEVGEVEVNMEVEAEVVEEKEEEEDEEEEEKEEEKKEKNNSDKI